MVGGHPMLGKNDDQGTFSQSDARDLVAFANANHIGSSRSGRPTATRTPVRRAVQCTNVPQTPFEFSKIFATFSG
jgi:hypothetical protein